MRTYLFLCLITFNTLVYSQKDENNVFKTDSIYHSKYVETFIDDLKSDGINDIIYLSDHNFATNDTYILWLSDEGLGSHIIYNKKLKTRIKKKKIHLSESLKQKLLLLFDKKNSYQFLNNYSDCESVLIHSYSLGVTINKQQYIVNSNCLSELKNNELISSLFQLMD